MAILTSAIVRECRERHAAGETLTALARHYGTSKPQMHKVLTRKAWAELPEERLCDECGKPGVEPSRSNHRKMHVACAAARHSSHPYRQNPGVWERQLALQSVRRAAQRAERYATDQAYRDRADVRRLHSLRGRPYLEALSWRVLWTRYRLREADFLRLLAWQREACPCSKPFDGKPYVDHDHACCPAVKSCGDCVRGLLHPRCNHLLAVVENNPDVITPAGWVKRYLAEPPFVQMRAVGWTIDGELTLW